MALLSANLSGPCYVRMLPSDQPSDWLILVFTGSVLLVLCLLFLGTALLRRFVFLPVPATGAAAARAHLNARRAAANPGMTAEEARLPLQTRC